MKIQSVILMILIKCIAIATSDDDPVWRWSCQGAKCVKMRNEARFQEPALSLDSCKMFCNTNGLLWPKPTGQLDLGNYFSKIKEVNFSIPVDSKTDDLTLAAVKRFENLLSLMIPEDVQPKKTGRRLMINIAINNPDLREFSLLTDESYRLTVSPTSEGDWVNATVAAGTFFGVRHGLETLAQLIVYDDIRNQILIVRDVTIEDKPVYPYRGLLLDTARNFFSIDSIKKTIEAMAVVKLNTFHWHITDSHSFPFVSERRPELSKYGAYSPRKVYTREAIQDVVRFGLERGVRVLPEFDAPAHVGEGWQDTGLTVCFKAQPWNNFCVEPPCGQLNPTKDELYNVLEDIFTDMAETFQSDMFHMGGDEVSDKCWNSSEEIREYVTGRGWALNETGFLNLWDHFQTQAQERAYKAFGKKLPLILWTSSLTEYKHIDEYLDKDDYIIQVWTTGSDPQIQGLLEKGYKLIMSNYDALYFDCGFGAWIGKGNNWCSPYIGWQKVYENSPAHIAGEYKDQILGGEAALWSEQVDSASLDGRFWPRAAALAERLWAEPKGTWEDAEHRMLSLRERLIKVGIQAESLQPEWCLQNEGHCNS